jgi:hypothetical protein
MSARVNGKVAGENSGIVALALRVAQANANEKCKR